uniref:Uncharacterized protein n=1 Tax=Ditylenchus dipsaci TaxID=166011 RepID=A0A915DIB3_9BILA
MIAYQKSSKCRREKFDPHWVHIHFMKIYYYNKKAHIGTAECRQYVFASVDLLLPVLSTFTLMEKKEKRAVTLSQPYLCAASYSTLIVWL